MKRLATIGLLMGLVLGNQQAAADFGEIDIVVRESIENHLRDYNKRVDLDTLDYLGDPELHGDTMLIRTSVWAEQWQIAPHWGWHECTTRLVIVQPGVYTDEGSDCFFVFD